MLPSSPPFLEVSHLKVYFPIFQGIFHRHSGDIRAIDDISFMIPEGKTLGLLGESGSGKTTIGRTLLKLIKPTSGEIFYKGHNIGIMSESIFHPWRKEIQMIFQDPHSSLNPKLRISSIIGESLEVHFPKMSLSERQDRIASLLTQVGLKKEVISRYPHELSGGERQRVSIARALGVEPKFLICDEPVSALDVSIQAQIINLLQDLQEELGLTMLFISHDVALLKHLSDWVVVLHHGKIVESGPTSQVLHHPQDLYTKTLLASVPNTIFKK